MVRHNKFLQKDQLVQKEIADAQLRMRDAKVSYMIDKNTLRGQESLLKATFSSWWKVREGRQKKYFAAQFVANKNGKEQEGLIMYTFREWW